MPNDIIFTGPPRSGTTLACFLLNKVADTIALHEPMNLRMFPDPVAGLVAVRSFFPAMRQSLLKDGTALSKVKDGMIPANPFGAEGANGRASIVNKGLVHFDKPLSPDFKLIIKHNGHFTFLLPELQDHYPIFVLLRHPVATIASWNSIEAPVAKGNLRVLQTLNPTLYTTLEAVPDLLDRQVQLLDEMYQAYLKATQATYLSYEDLISSGGSSLASISSEAAKLSVELASKNSNPLYDENLCTRIKAQLLARSGAYLDFYSPSVIENF